MTIETLTKGAVLTEDQISQYGLEKTDLKMSDGASQWKKGRKRVLLEPREDRYIVGLVYELPYLGA